MVKIQKRYYVLIVVALLVSYIILRDFYKSPSFEIIKNAETTEVLSESLTEDANRVNINTADLDVLITLPGIGEETARKIIDYRETNGAFEVIEDILKIPSIGDKKFESLKENICVE